MKLIVLVRSFANAPKNGRFPLSTMFILNYTGYRRGSEIYGKRRLRSYGHQGLFQQYGGTEEFQETSPVMTQKVP